MATGFVYEKAVKKLVNGTFDLDGQSYKAALLDGDHVPDEINDEFWSDVSGDEVSGTGYTAGGQTLQNLSITFADGVLVWDASDPYWAAGNYTFDYVVIYNNTLTNKDLLLLLDYEGTVDPEGNAFYVRFDNPDGLIKITKV